MAGITATSTDPVSGTVVRLTGSPIFRSQSILSLPLSGGLLTSRLGSGWRSTTRSGAKVSGGGAQDLFAESAARGPEPGGPGDSLASAECARGTAHGAASASKEGQH